MRIRGKEREVAQVFESLEKRLRFKQKINCHEKLSYISLFQVLKTKNKSEAVCHVCHKKLCIEFLFNNFQNRTPRFYPLDFDQIGVSAWRIEKRNW